MNGLTSEQVQERIRQGKVNLSQNPTTRTYKQIFLHNTCTFFNFLNIGLLVIVLLVGSYRNSAFVGIVLWNTLIGIVQEIRAKRTIDKLAILSRSKCEVLRDGAFTEIDTEELVEDDLFRIRSGDQIPADAKVISGCIEVNESLLTGEPDNLMKREGDALYSGSYAASGEAILQAVKVGADSYVSKLTREAKAYKAHDSQLRNSLNIILKSISILILPVGALLFAKQYYIAQASIRDAVVNTVAGMLGMIPEGLILLSSVALTLGAMTLARKKTLVQELYCIETLAHVDVLCLDKTGTLTEGRMKVEQILPIRTREGQRSSEEIRQVMQRLLGVLKDDNATAKALRAHFGVVQGEEPAQLIPFSSERKYSGAAFESDGTWMMGAVQFLFPEGNRLLEEACEKYAQQGFRVLVLAHSPQIAEETARPGDLAPAALFLLSDVIREQAPDTLRYFREQGVTCKVISGDDPVTVSAVAMRAGMEDADRLIDVSGLSDEELDAAAGAYTVFGRVRPEQKKKLVLALKKAGHTVGMTGDGVNDVPALKASDCSIAMAAGSEAAKNIANIVLLDSNFASMPHVVNQGRKVINNIRTAACMFLIKTLFSLMLSFLTIFFGEAYPFEPIQMSLISACAVGIPTFLLAMEPNYEPIGDSFLRHVFIHAFPAAVTITVGVFANMLVCTYIYNSNEMLGTACVLVTGWNYMYALKTVYAPLTAFRKTVIYCMQFLFFLAAVVLQNLLFLGTLEFGMIIQVFLLMTFAPVLTDLLTTLIGNYYQKHPDLGKNFSMSGFGKALLQTVKKLFSKYA